MRVRTIYATKLASLKWNRCICLRPQGHNTTTSGALNASLQVIYWCNAFSRLLSAGWGWDGCVTAMIATALDDSSDVVKVTLERNQKHFESLTHWISIYFVLITHWERYGTSNHAHLALVAFLAEHQCSINTKRSQSSGRPLSSRPPPRSITHISTFFIADPETLRCF